MSVPDNQSQFIEQKIENLAIVRKNVFKIIGNKMRSADAVRPVKSVSTGDTNKIVLRIFFIFFVPNFLFKNNGKNYF